LKEAVFGCQAPWASEPAPGPVAHPRVQWPRQVEPRTADPQIPDKHDAQFVGTNISVHATAIMRTTRAKATVAAYNLLSPMQEVS